MKLSATNRLYIGFATAFIISVIIGVTTFLTLQNQAEEAVWVKHTYEVMNNVRTIENTVVEMQTGRRGYRITGEEVFLEPYFNGLQKMQPAIDRLKEKVKDNPVQARRANELDEHVNQQLLFWQKLSKTVETYTKEEALSITEQEKKQMDIIRKDIRDMLNTENELLAKRQTDSSNALSLASKLSVSGTILIEAIILILIYFIISEFNTRKKAEHALQENLNELNVLNEESNNRNWLLTGVASVNESMQGIEDVSSLSRSVLHAIVRYLDVAAGAIYLYNEESEHLVLKASEALPGSVQKVYGVSEGMPGKAAESRELLVVSNVSDNYWNITSASGAAKPGEIMFLPLWYNDELIGVIELAAFGNFTALQTQLADVIVKNVGIAINSVNAREKVMHLLEQVQEQKVNLQNQQEELRQTNEELTRQAEVLQASEEELRVQEEELRQINAELEEKNEAVELSRQALFMKARELEITGKYKSEFLANMSHELRTPLNSVLILAKILSENKATNLTDKQVEYANIIHKSGTDLLNLINDILDLSKIEAGKADFNFEDVLVKGIIQDVSPMFNVIAEEKSIVFNQFKDENVPDKFYTDKLRLEQVIKNLLSNAFKFTPKNGHILLSFTTSHETALLNEDHLRKADKVLVISVADTGIGIAKDKQQIVFEAFQQADGSTSRKYGGTGLGLSISKELVKKLGGELKLESEEGKGSTFSIYLPLEKVEGLEETKEDAPLAEGEDIQIDISHVSEQTTLQDDRASLQKGDKIMLIIEDDPKFASIVQDFARLKKYKTIVALQGDEGLYYARKYKPSAIILDIQLPVIDGWTILKILKSDKSLKKIPVHVISATDDIARAKNAAVAFVKKPLEKEDLENAFITLSGHVKSDIKKVLVFSGGYVKDDQLKRMIDDRHFDIECDYVSNGEEAAKKLDSEQYDSVIVDIGNDLEKGKKELLHIQRLIGEKRTPVILYLDKDLSTQDELQLKKLSNVVIRDSSQSQARLMDELELFLYKVQEGDKGSVPQVQRVLNDEYVLKGKKVLLADDDMRNVFALTTLLEQQQMEIITAEDGKEALAKLNENPDVDIVLMDVMMPEMDGYEATRKIRTDKRFKNLPIIALTAKAMQGDREKTIDAGASDYITKPVDGARLFSLMRVWLSV